MTGSRLCLMGVFGISGVKYFVFCNIVQVNFFYVPIMLCCSVDHYTEFGKSKHIYILFWLTEQF
jgi:hypothetical protein